MYWIDNVSTTVGSVCNEPRSYMYVVYDMGCDWIRYLGEYCSYGAAVSFINNSVGVVPDF